jgi:hypothetical protein
MSTTAGPRPALVGLLAAALLLDLVILRDEIEFRIAVAECFGRATHDLISCAAPREWSIVAAVALLIVLAVALGRESARR